MEEGRIILDIEIKPAAAGRSNKKETVTVNGGVVPVLGEKESLTSLGRDEILDTRASKMDLLSGSAAEDEPLPEELQTPIAVATDLLDDSVLASEPAPMSEHLEAESTNASPEAHPDAGENAPQVVVSPPEAPPADSATSGLLRFWHAYPNPLLRFTTPVGRRSSEPSTGAPLERSPGLSTEGSQARNVSVVAGNKVEALGLLTRQVVVRRSYPLSMVIIVALIAFLVGSFLRSLLSPADFIYVVSDRKDLEDMNAGWRELRRLFEVKYILGGWDFQIAVVRRH